MHQEAGLEDGWMDEFNWSHLVCKMMRLKNPENIIYWTAEQLSIPGARGHISHVIRNVKPVFVSPTPTDSPAPEIIIEKKKNDN